MKQRKHDRGTEIRELAIQGSAHIICSNTELGLKQAMPNAYHADMKKRAEFARIFSRVLDTGTKFDRPSTTVSKHNVLCEVNTQPSLVYQATHRVSAGQEFRCESAAPVWGSVAHDYLGVTGLGHLRDLSIKPGRPYDTCIIEHL